ncbi:MAG: patatin-like phospholipase family protein [Clostridia bacterium]|nr:patatin-like phospholipase family protein [Clostridia bacterium]
MEFNNSGITFKTTGHLLNDAFNMPAPVPDKIENLVFSGGGTKGVAYVGVLRILDQMGVSQKIKRYAGASAGAITAALLAIGMSTDDIEKNLPTSFMKFLDPEKGNTDDIIKELERIGKIIGGSIDIWDIFKVIWSKGLILDPEKAHMGLFQGIAFLNWLKGCFESKKLPGDITFKQLYDKTGKELHLMLCNSNYGKTLVANHINTPDMPVTLAVRCSMAIPFFFYPMTYNGDLFVDGGTMYNYPIEIFDSITNPECTLGFILSTASSVLWPERSADNNLAQHIGRVLGAFMNVSYEYCFREGNASRTVFIDPADVSAINFNLTPEQIKALKENGRKAAITFFQSKYGPDGNLPIQRKDTFPVVVPPGKTLSVKFNFDVPSSTETKAVVLTGDLFDGNSDILKKASDTSSSSSWQWTNTGKTNKILFASGWAKANGWVQAEGSVITHNSISFDAGFSASYNIS